MLRLDRFARYPLTFGPTPIEFLPRLTAALGGQVEIWAKRDDCNSGLALERQALLEVPISRRRRDGAFVPGIW